MFTGWAARRLGPSYTEGEIFTAYVGLPGPTERIHFLAALCQLVTCGMGVATTLQCVSIWHVDSVNGVVPDPNIPQPTDRNEAAAHETSTFASAVGSRSITDEGSVPPLVLDTVRFVHAATGGQLPTDVVAGLFTSSDVRTTLRTARVEITETTLRDCFVAATPLRSTIQAPVLINTFEISSLLKKIPDTSVLALQPGLKINIRKLLVKSPTSATPQAIRLRGLCTTGDFGRKELLTKVHSYVRTLANALLVDYNGNRSYRCVQFYDFGFSAGSSSNGMVLGGIEGFDTIEGLLVEGLPLTYSSHGHCTVIPEIRVPDAADSGLFLNSVSATAARSSELSECASEFEDLCTRNSWCVVAAWGRFPPDGKETTHWLQLTTGTASIAVRC